MQEMGFRTRSNSLAGLEGYASAAMSQMALVRSSGGGFASQMEMVACLAEFGRFVENDPIITLPDEMVMLGGVFGTLSALFVHYRPAVSATGQCAAGGVRGAGRADADAPGGLALLHVGAASFVPTA